MKILWDECVSGTYQKEYKREHPDNEYDAAQKVGLGGGDDIMKGLNPEQRDLKLADEAANRGYDCVISTDKKFLAGVAPENIPINSIVVDIGNDAAGGDIPPTAENLRQVTPQIEQELGAIEQGEYPNPQIIKVSPELATPTTDPPTDPPTEPPDGGGGGSPPPPGGGGGGGTSEPSSPADAQGGETDPDPQTPGPLLVAPDASKLEETINDPNVTSIEGVKTTELQNTVAQATTTQEGLEEADTEIHKPFSESESSEQSPTPEQQAALDAWQKAQGTPEEAPAAGASETAPESSSPTKTPDDDLDM